jgi:hypothetical protein
MSKALGSKCKLITVSCAVFALSPASKSSKGSRKPDPTMEGGARFLPGFLSRSLVLCKCGNTVDLVQGDHAGMRMGFFQKTGPCRWRLPDSAMREEEPVGGGLS